MVSFEVMHYLKRKKFGKEGYMALKLDMSKAYDRVEWTFLRGILLKMGFSDWWAHLIMQCVMSVSYNIVHGEHVIGPICPSRGLRQGDPLSPYLFIICAEGLSALIHQYEERKLIHGIRICNKAPIVSHMLFADDSYVYCKADTNEADKVLELLKVYEDASGQKINKEKSSVFFSGNVIQYNRVEVSHKLGMKEADEHSTYLGLPNILGRKKSVVLAYLKDRVQNRIQSWRPKKFSKPTKEILIKTATQSLPVFAMNVFLLPIEITKEIEKMLANFWWSSTDSGGRTINWMAWDRMTKHKHSGGLGFRSFRDFNLAMLGKQCWRLITNPNSLTAQIYKARYFKDTSFLEASLGSSPSFIWRSLLEAKNVILTGSSWRVGTGNDINIIGQPWLGNKENAFVTTVSPSIVNQKVSSLMCTGTRNWDWEVIADIFNNRDQESIQATIIEEELDSDMLQWDWDITGQYTVKSAYNLLQVQKGAWTVHDDDSSWKALWKIKAPKKALSVLWRALTHCLPTKMQLIQKRVQVDSLCEICKSGVENTAHIFLHCPFAASCWEVLQVSPVWDSTWEFANWFEQCLLHESKENKVKMIMLC